MLLPSHPGPISGYTLPAAPAKQKKKRKRRETPLEHAVPFDTDPKIERKKQRHWVVTSDGSVRITLEMVQELIPKAKAIECHSVVEGNCVFTYIHCQKQIHESQIKIFANNVNEKYLHADTIAYDGCNTKSMLLISTGTLALKWLFHHFNQLFLRLKAEQEGVEPSTIISNETFHACTDGVAEIKPDSPFWKGAVKDYKYRTDSSAPQKLKSPRKTWNAAEYRAHIAKLEEWNKKLALEADEAKKELEDVKQENKVLKSENAQLKQAKLRST